MQGLKQVGKNVELQNYTQAFYDARELALSRMQAEAEAEKADGIVGASVKESNYGWGTHVIEFFAIGTAITSISDNHEIPTPTLILPLI